MVEGEVQLLSGLIAKWWLTINVSRETYKEVKMNIRKMRLYSLNTEINMSIRYLEDCLIKSDNKAIAMEIRRRALQLHKLKQEEKISFSAWYYFENRLLSSVCKLK